MSNIIRIGHASSTEFNTATGGSPGDSTGKEVCIVEEFKIGGWYKPTVVLRPATVELAEKAARACEAGCLNANIGYDQSGRKTLVYEAFLTGFDLSKISTPCETDCTAFVSTCAMAAGARIDYNYTDISPKNANDLDNPPYTGNIRSRLSKYGDYLVLTADKYLTQTDYLRRGDILVAETGNKHAVMVLSNGKNYSDTDTPELGLPPGTEPTPETPTILPEEDLTQSRLQISLKVSLSNIETTRIVVTSKVTKIENGQEKPMIDKDFLALYTWTCQIVSLRNNFVRTKSLSITSDTVDFCLSGLNPGNPYALQIMASKTIGTDEFSSQQIIFNTPAARPKSIKNLKVKLDNNAVTGAECTINFDPPDSWGSLDSLEKGYRVSLIINGQTVAYSDELIKASTAHVRKVVRLSDFTENVSFTYNDMVQIGIQTWLKDTTDNFIFDNDFPVCSEPVYIEYFLKSIDKIYIKDCNTYKQAIIYNKEVY